VNTVMWTLRLTGFRGAKALDQIEFLLISGQMAGSAERKSNSSRKLIYGIQLAGNLIA
jgi:hypothetical protein